PAMARGYAFRNGRSNLQAAVFNAPLQRTGLPARSWPGPAAFQTTQQLPGHLEGRRGLPAVLMLGDLARARHDGGDGLRLDAQALEKRQQFQQDKIGGEAYAVPDNVEDSVGHLQAPSAPQRPAPANS